MMDRVLSRVQVVGLESLLAVAITCSILIMSRNVFTIWSRKFLHISLCYILAKNIANFWLTKRRPACSDRLDCLVVICMGYVSVVGEITLLFVYCYLFPGVV